MSIDFGSTSIVYCRSSSIGTVTHPASWPCSSSSSSANAKSSKRCLDDFMIAEDKLRIELKVVELANMVHLCRVKRFADFRKNLEALRERKHRVEEVMCYAMTSDSVRANLRTMNAVRPVTSVLSNLDHSHHHSVNGGSVNGNGHRRVKQECFWYVSSGAEEDRSNANGVTNGASGILQELHAGQDVDLLLGGDWVVGRVLRLRKDRNFIRQAKVRRTQGLI